jgi:hypothetical protein
VPADAVRTATRDAAHRHDDRDRSHHEPAPVERIALAGITTGGAPLPPDVRADMEARLGGDFSAVRVHIGDAAGRSAHELAAEAYTVGDDIVFARGAYAPYDPLGRLRLAHELAHVLQQRSGTAPAGISDRADPLEAAAENTARTALAGPRPTDVSRPPAGPGPTDVSRPSAGPRAAPGRMVVQRRALLDLPPARERASELAAESPWLGMTAAGMIDFRTSTPTLTPSPDARDAAADRAPDRAGSGGGLDPLAQPEPRIPEPRREARAEPDNEAPPATDRSAQRGADEQLLEKPAEDASAGKSAQVDEDDPRAAEDDSEAAEDDPQAAEHDGQLSVGKAGQAAGSRPADPRAAPVAGQQRKGKRDGGIELQLPKFPDQTAKEFAGLVAADRQGQRALQAAVAKALADVAALMGRESAKVDAGLAGAEEKITTAVHTARRRVQGSAATARARVDRARAEQGSRATKQLDRKKETASTDVDGLAKQIEAVGSRRADEAQKINTDAATELEATRVKRISDAQKTGADRAARAASSSSEPQIRAVSVNAQQQAAWEIAKQTMAAIDDAIKGSVLDLQGGGSELKRKVDEKVLPLATKMREQVPPIVASLTRGGTELAATLDGAVVNARQTIESTTRGLMDALNHIDRQTKQQLRTAANDTKAGLRKAHTDGERQLHDKASESVQTAHKELLQRLQVVSSRPVRRVIARRLANQLRSVLRSGYGMGAQQANQIAGRIASQLSGALAQFHQALTAAIEPAISGAESTAQSAGAQFSQIERRVVDLLSNEVTNTLTGADTTLTDRMTELAKSIKVVDEKLQPFVDDTRTKVTDEKARLNGVVVEKVGDLDSRIEQAMSKAHDKAEYGAFFSWLWDQIKAFGRAFITPSFWVGLLVGLVIVIVGGILFAPGILAGILIGAVAGAVSAAAAYITQVSVDERWLTFLGQKTQHKEFSADELKKQMITGAIAGGVGGAFAGGTTGAVKVLVVKGLVTSAARQAAVNKAAQAVVGVVLGVVQNCMTGEDGGLHLQWNWDHWDEGLLTNIVVTGVMSLKPVEERMHAVQTRARNRMVARGLAFNVDAKDMTGAQAHMFERAGVTDPTAPHPATAAVPDLSGVHIDAGVTAPVGPPVGEQHPPALAEPHGPPAAGPVEPHVPPVEPLEPRVPLPAEPHVPPVGLVELQVPPPAEPQLRPGEARRAASGKSRPKPPAAPVAGAPKREGLPRAAGDRAAGAASHEPQFIELPDHAVMHNDDKPMTEHDARDMYEGARRETPEHEAAIFRNSETGEHIVIQGNNERVEPNVERNAQLKEFLKSRPGQTGRWELIEHSHAVDATRGVTPESQRLPSGQGGDFDNTRAVSIARGGQPVEQRIGIVTERGNEIVRYGYDPNHELPYSLTYPGPDGQPISERFKSMEDYGQWYEKHTGGGSPHVAGEGGIAAPPRSKGRGGAGTSPSGDAGTAPSKRQRAKRPPVPEEVGAGAGAPARERASGAHGAGTPRHDAPPPLAPAEARPVAGPIREGPPRPRDPALHGGSVAEPALLPDHPAEPAPAPVPEHLPEEHAPALVPEHLPEEHAPAAVPEHLPEEDLGPAGKEPPPEEHAAAAPGSPHTPASKPAAGRRPSLAKDKPGTWRDAKNRLHGAKGFIEDWLTNERHNLVERFSKGKTAKRTVTEYRAKPFTDTEMERTKWYNDYTAARERVAKIAAELEIKPTDFAFKEKLTAKLKELKEQGIPPQKRRELLHAERARMRTLNELNRQSKRLGMLAGEDVLHKEGMKQIAGSAEDTVKQGEVKNKAEQDQFDLIGVSDNGDRLQIIEAKGGKADIKADSGRYIEKLGGKAQQGSHSYLEDLLHHDKTFRKYLDAHPDFARRLAAGEVKIEYRLVQAPGDGTVKVTELKIRPKDLQLSDLAPPGH